MRRRAEEFDSDGFSTPLSAPICRRRRQNPVLTPSSNIVTMQTAPAACSMVDISTLAGTTVLTSDPDCAGGAGSITVHNDVDFSQISAATIRGTNAGPITIVGYDTANSDLSIENLPANALVYDIQDEIDAVSF